jgi:ribosomal protein S12 methylthiotransferase accessory factor
MLPRPRLKSSLRAEFVDGEGLYLLGEDERHVLRGRAFQALLPLLDGSRTEEELCLHLAGALAPAEVFYALTLLRQRGLLVEGRLEVPLPEAAFWEGLGVEPASARGRLASARVELTPLGQVDAGSLAEALAELGLSVSPGAERSVVLVEDHLHPELAAFNRARLADGRPWLLVRPTGLTAWLGPLFVPGHTGCWRCLAHRLEGHRRVERYLEQRLGKAVLPPAPSALSATRRLVAGLVSTTVARWVVEGRLPALEGQVLTFGAATFESRSHPVTRRPQCPDCGDAGLMARRQREPVVLEPSPRVFTADGGHRQVDPEETLHRVSRHFSPVSGIVNRLTRTGQPGDDARLLFSYSTDHNFVLLADDLQSLRHNLRGFSGGKGRTDAQARASALCESIERYSGVWQGDEARRRATLEELGEEALHPQALLGFSARQYARRQEWNRLQELFSWVPEPFEPDRPIDWSPVWSLTRERWRFVSTALCYYGYPFAGAPVFGLADSNGCAAGNTRTEAILQGFFELVERDAAALWWYNRLRRPGVDLAGFGEPYLLDVARHWRSRGRELWALDLTTDLGIPTFAAVSRRVEGPGESVIFGFGTHLDARVALLRAVTEHNQFMPLLPVAEASGAGTFSRWVHEVRVEQEPFLVPAPDVAPRTAADFPRHQSAELREDVAHCVELARRAGLETLVLDQTRPDTGLAVVKVWVPGLRHFWARLGPGRLYDVPVRMGLLPAPLPEEALNPYPMFL